MKKLFFSLVILVSLGFLWYKAAGFSRTKLDQLNEEKQTSKATILSFALVSDSENDNENLKKALEAARGNEVDFVVGLGDFTKLGEEGDLLAAKNIFDASGLTYYVTAGDRDLWASRNVGEEATHNFKEVFGNPTREFDSEGIGFLVISDADIYKGISPDDWALLNSFLTKAYKLKFVFTHKTPYHPQSAHVMGADNAEVARQADQLIKLIEENKVNGFFSGDLHFFARFNSPNGVKITTIGALNRERTFQGPRFAVVKVYDDYSWEVEDVELN